MAYHLLWTFAVAFALTQVAVFSTTIYLHRTQTHRALTLHPVVDRVFRFALWITTGINRLYWEAVHLKHHAYADREGDPHSPIIKGYWRVQFFNIYYYIAATRNKDVLTFARSKEDSWDRLFNQGVRGLLLGITLLCVIMGPGWGLLAAGIHAVLYVVVVPGLINGFCHIFGYKNFANHPGTNSRMVAWMTGGEGLHNNHHGQLRCAKFSIRPSEFDPAWRLGIKPLMTLGLAEPYRGVGGLK